MRQIKISNVTLSRFQEFKDDIPALLIEQDGDKVYIVQDKLATFMQAIDDVMNSKPKYIFLDTGDTIQEGDEWYSVIDRVWTSADSYLVGRLVEGTDTFRRKVEE